MYCSTGRDYNYEAWSPEELVRLKELAEKYGGYK